MIKKSKRCLKKFDLCDAWCIKTGSAAFILFLITVWPAFNELIMKVHWGWFLGATVILMWKPFMKWIKA
jgi:hypothetical protein